MLRLFGVVRAAHLMQKQTDIDTLIIRSHLYPFAMSYDESDSVRVKKEGSSWEGQKGTVRDAKEWESVGIGLYYVTFDNPRLGGWFETHELENAN